MNRGTTTVAAVRDVLRYVTECHECGYSKPCQIDDCGVEHSAYAYVPAKRGGFTTVMLCADHTKEVTS